MHVLDSSFIFRKGDEGEEMFFIKSGKVEICSEKGDIIFVTLSEGAFFGEIALFESCKRTASARAKGACELCTLSKEDFNNLMETYPIVAAKIRETIAERKSQEERKKAEAAAAALQQQQAIKDLEASHKTSKHSLTIIGGGKSSAIFAKSRSYSKHAKDKDSVDDENNSKHILPASGTGRSSKLVLSDIDLSRNKIGQTGEEKIE